MSTQFDHDVLVKDEEKLDEPSMYNVVLLNDDYTPMVFVVDLLINLFGHSDATAVDLMMDVHENGSAIAGTFSKDVAETKVAQVHATAQSAGHPLRATVSENK